MKRPVKYFRDDHEIAFVSVAAEGQDLLMVFSFLITERTL